ncbi:hypothetical protein GGR57DRAFT_492380 [Xylariaceae sp. FL1272]|nr:hypothetical protein GGR57DRAFT_492380 [Xylariaceae sp. FL1272]
MDRLADGTDVFLYAWCIAREDASLLIVRLSPASISIKHQPALRPSVEDTEGRQWRAAAVFAALLLQWEAGTASAPPLLPIAGHNNTALFVVTSDHGLSNHPHIRLHFASFAPLEMRPKRLSQRATSGSGIVFHAVEWLSIIDTCRTYGKNTSNSQISHIIDDINPAVVVIDTLFRPALDATRDKNRLHAIISPNTLIEDFPADQPLDKMFWKYPAMGSGLPYPGPWSKIPLNILLNAKFISTTLWMPDIREKQNYLRSKGLRDPINSFALHRPDVPWLSQTMVGASIPVDFVPINVTCTGPMTMSAPTVLINLGAGFKYAEARATTMVHAIEKVLQVADLQIIWKITKEGSYSDGFLEPLVPFATNGRSGHIVASVHHGGSGCYHEAINAGVPQIVLPQCLDLYGFAQLVEYTGVGVWGCKQLSPNWSADCISEAILQVLNADEMSEAAVRLMESAREKPDKYIAAQVIAGLAGSGV